MKMSNNGQNKQIAVTGSGIDDYKKLASFLREKGYSLGGILADLKEGDTVVAVIVDPKTKTAYNTSVTIMACRASCGLKPVTVDEFINNQ